MRTQPCILAGHRLHRCRGHISAHHVVRVGSGGKDAGNLIPACQCLHDQCHSRVPAWTELLVEAVFEISMKGEAARLHERLTGTL